MSCEHDGDILDLLEQIKNNTSGDDYEPGGVFSVGGPTGTYVIRSPYNTECEWALFAATVSAGSGIMVISASNPATLPMTAAAPTIGSTANGMDTNGFEGLVLPLSTTQNYIPFEFWQPLGRGTNIYVNVTMTGGNAYALVSIRRKSQKFIPLLRSPKPHSHVPLSGRGARTFYGGYDEARHGSIEGGVHDIKPVEDTALFKRHGMPGVPPAPGSNPMAELDKKVSRGRR